MSCSSKRKLNEDAFYYFLLKTFQIWKEEKDEEIKEKLRRKREEEREKQYEEEEKKREKEKENQTALRGWYVCLCYIAQQKSVKRSTSGKTLTV